jgi:hypothetical protein
LDVFGNKNILEGEKKNILKEEGTSWLSSNTNLTKKKIQKRILEL